MRFWQTSETLWRHTLEVTSGNPIARGNLGSALVEQARFADGAEQFREALRLKPFYPEAESNLGFAVAMQGQLDEAMMHYRQALAWKPRLERTHFLLGNALLTQGNRSDAIAEYRIALEINPDWPAALNDLGWILATDPSVSVRNGTEAVALAERACSVTGFRNPQFIGTLAAAYAEVGRFPDAIAAAERAKELATKQGNPPLAQRNEELLQYYRRGEAYHESEPLINANPR
jgi:tetratricopeptide (TPR) repeat protein